MDDLREEMRNISQDLRKLTEVVRNHLNDCSVPKQTENSFFLNPQNNIKKCKSLCHVIFITQ